MRRGRLILGVAIVLVFMGGTVAAISLSHKDSPAQPSADLSAIQAEIDAGQYENAQAELEQILSTDDGNAEAHFKLGLVMFNLGDYQVAEDHFVRSLALEPDRAAAVHHNLGVLAYQTGDMDKALAEFRSALEADPEDADTHYQLGATYLVQAYPMGAIQPDADLLQKAQAEFERALQITPEKPEALVGMANIEMLQNNMADAITLLEKALQQEPEMREALFALGRSYAAVGEVDKARVTLAKFLDTNPPTVWAEQAQQLLTDLGGE